MEKTDIKALAAQFKGRKFGELVLLHMRQQPIPQLVNAMQGTLPNLRPEVQSVAMDIIDAANPLAGEKEFWADDCGQVLLFMATLIEKELQKHGLTAINDELLDLFNMIVLNFAYSAHQDSGLEKFIKTSTGTGLWGRLFA